jgi:hypothetical protein
MDQREMARLGGLKIKEKYGNEYFKELRKKRTNYSRRHKLIQKDIVDNNGKP